MTWHFRVWASGVCRSGFQVLRSLISLTLLPLCKRIDYTDSLNVADQVGLYIFVRDFEMKNWIYVTRLRLLERIHSSL